MKTHKDLDIWKRGIGFVEHIYKVTAKFPREEIYGLTSQIRRSAISYPSNIAEGAARSSKKEFIKFSYIALGSLSEAETQLIIAEKLRYLLEIWSINFLLFHHSDFQILLKTNLMLLVCAY